MAKLYYTNKAISDLSSIWEYTVENWSELQADKYYSKIVSACNSLLDSSLVLPKNYDKVSPELYGVKSGHHIVFYKKQVNDDVLIVRILHERMDLKRHL